MKKGFAAMILVAAWATAAWAGWGPIAEVTAGGEAKELAVNRAIRTVQIECTEGSVIVNMIWVREDAAKTPIKVARLFNKGEKQNIDLGSARLVTGLRISDGGKGKYKIQAQ
jgi:hypothetical protein